MASDGRKDDFTRIQLGDTSIFAAVDRGSGGRYVRYSFSNEFTHHSVEGSCTRGEFIRQMDRLADFARYDPIIQQVEKIG